MLAAAVAIETYFQNERWPSIAAIAVIGATVTSIVLMALRPPSRRLATPSIRERARRVGDLFPPALRLLTPFMNITGTFALVLGALFSAYVFMPKKRVLNYSLDPGQSGDSFLFNLAIAPVAITVNFFASLPGAFRALIARSTPQPGAGNAPDRPRGPGRRRRRHLWPTRVHRFLPARQARSASILLFLGFLVSIEVFSDIRIPFTSRVLRGGRHEPAAISASSGDRTELT